MVDATKITLVRCFMLTSLFLNVLYCKSFTDLYLSWSTLSAAFQLAELGYRGKHAGTTLG